MKQFDVLLAPHAEDDLRELIDYIEQQDGPIRAEQVQTSIEGTLRSLATMPARGAIPRELDALGIRAYRQTLFKPYRIIYEIIGDQVHVLVIADGRRDLQTLLMRRLIQP